MAPAHVAAGAGLEPALSWVTTKCPYLWDLPALLATLARWPKTERYASELAFSPQTTDCSAIELQSHMESQVGFEPTTNCLEDSHSDQTELLRRIWSMRQASNLQPLVYKTSALRFGYTCMFGGKPGGLGRPRNAALANPELRGERLFSRQLDVPTLSNFPSGNA